MPRYAGRRTFSLQIGWNKESEKNMSIRISVLLIFSTISIGCRPDPLPSNSLDITAQELREHVRFLASDELEGRASGTRGNDAAAQYIVEQFSSYGLQPMGENGTYFQNFPILSSLKVGKKNELALRVEGKSMEFSPNEDFHPLSFSADTTVANGLVFVGYGISADSLHFDDYANIDVRGKIVLVFRFTPDYGRSDSKFYDHAPLYRKAYVAREKGAAGMILVTGPADEEKPMLIPLRAEQGLRSLNIAAVNLKSTSADSLLQMAGVKKNLRTLQQEIYDTKTPKSFEIPNVFVKMTTEVVKVYSPTANVIGYLEGNDPTVKNEVIIIGAHYDHVGWGGHGSGSLLPDTNAIHNGADDNASGTAALLELAQSLSSRRQEVRRSYMFIAFSAEERGLLGSTFYVDHPSLPLGKAAAMINLDMVGRLRDSTLNIHGIGTSPIWQSILEKENTAFGFQLKFVQSGFGPSDHSSFYAKDIPILFFFTGLHDDYHKPGDDWNKLNYEGEQRVTQFVLHVAKTLDAVEKPKFTRVQTEEREAVGRSGFRVIFGIVPNYAEETLGVKISGTRPASPAEKAGLKGGDIIMKFGGKDVKTIYDLTDLLQKYNPGDEVEVVFKRDAETKTVVVKLEARR